MHKIRWTWAPLFIALFLCNVAEAQSGEEDGDDDGEQHTCNDAVYLPPPYTSQLIVGSTTSKPLPDDTCSPSQPSITYLITPSEGNEVVLKACGAGPLTNLVVTVYSDSCWNPKCVDSQILSSARDCASTLSMLSFIAVESEYWVVVTTHGTSEGQFSLTLDEHIVRVPICTDPMSLFGPYDPSLTLYGAVSAGGPATDMPCDGGAITTDLQWYTIYPYETHVTVSTCNPGSIAATNVQVFTGDCDYPTCVTYETSSQCSNGATVTFTTNVFIPSYYVVVYGRDGSTGSFQLTVSERFDLPPSPSESPRPSPSPSSSARSWYWHYHY